MVERTYGSFQDVEGMHGFTRDDIAEMSKDQKIRMMVSWFHAHFEDPAHRTPYESREGGYQWVWGGPHEANDEVQGEFGEVVDYETMKEAIDEIESDGLRDITSDRRLAILAVCAIEWAAAITDAVIETHDRIVGKTWRDAKKLCDARIADARSSLQETLRSFKSLGAALLEAKGDGASLDDATETGCGWARLESMVAIAAELTDTMAADALAHVVHGYHRFRRYAPRMLRALNICCAPVAAPLIKAARIIADDKAGAPREMSLYPN